MEKRVIESFKEKPCKCGKPPQIRITIEDLTGQDFKTTDYFFCKKCLQHANPLTIDFNRGKKDEPTTNP